MPATDHLYELLAAIHNLDRTEALDRANRLRQHLLIGSALPHVTINVARLGRNRQSYTVARPYVTPTQIESGVPDAR